MRVITNRRLIEFAQRHPAAGPPLQAWRKTMEATAFAGFSELRQSFGSVDKVGDLHVFDIGGNKFRLIAVVRYACQKVYIRAVLTHKEYDKGAWKRGEK